MDDELQDESGAYKGLNLADPDVAARYAAAEAPCGRIRIALAQGQVELARRVLTDAEHTVRRLAGGDRLETTPLAQIEGLPQRWLELLEREADLITIGDLLGVRRETLATLHGLGDRGVTEILLVLLKHTVKACRSAEGRLVDLEGGRP